jgi:soluble lytic murein transglycosylase
VIFTSSSIAADRILPLPKPQVEEEIIKRTAKKKEIYPEKKPITKKDEKEIELPQEVAESIDEEKKESFIYPKKKPVIVQVQKKVDKAIHKSAILSKKDFKIAIAAFKSIEKKKWKTALKLSKKARDKTLYKLVNYLYLIKTSNAASFY